MNPLATLNVRPTSNANFLVWSSTNLGASTLELSNNVDANDAYSPMEFSASKFNFNAGNVGIGTVSPDFKLEIEGGRSQFAAASEPYAVGARYVSTGGAVYFGAASNFVTPDAVFSNAGGAELVRFTNGGNVGIGTTTPGGLLDLYGNPSGSIFLNLETSIAGRSNWAIKREDVHGSELNFVYSSTANGTPNTSALYLSGAGAGSSGAGNVGIGDTNPGVKLTVGDGTAASSLRVQGNVSGSKNSYIQLTDTSGSSLGVSAIVGGVTKLNLEGGSGNSYFNGGGNVGIGTTGPGAKVEVNGPTTAPSLTWHTSNLLNLYNVSYGETAFGIDANSGWLQVRGGSNNPVPLSLNPLGGNVGVATTSPWRALSVTGTVGFDGLTAGAGAGALCLSANKEVTYSAGAGCTGSSQRFKHDIAPLDASTSLDEVLRLNPVSFVYNDDVGVKGPQVGLIAEQVQQVEPRLVATDASGTPFTVKYENLTAILASAIQKLFAQLSDLAATVASFAEKITTKELVATNVTADNLAFKVANGQKLCLGSTCITETQLAALLSQSAAAGLANPSPALPHNQFANPTPPTATSTNATDLTSSTNSGQASSPTVIESVPPIIDSPPLAPEVEPEPTIATTTASDSPVSEPAPTSQ